MQKIAAGTSVPIVVAGNYIFVEQLRSNTGFIIPEGWGTSVTIKPDTSNVAIPLIAFDSGYEFPTSYNTLTISSAAGNPEIYVVLWVGFGRYEPSVIRTGPLIQNFTDDVLVTSAAAYAVGNAVGGGTNGIVGFFLPGLERFRVRRARISFTIAAPAGADVSLVLWNGDVVSVPAVDHAAFSDSSGNIPALQPPIRFPIFRSDGTSAYSYCDVTDFCSEMVAGIGSTGKNLYWQLVANAAFSLANPTTVRLDISGENF